MELLANAKINLTLDILRRREDGYHDLQMVMQSVTLADEITVTPAQGAEGQAVSDLRFLPTGGKNLAQVAAAVFRSAWRTFHSLNSSTWAGGDFGGFWTEALAEKRS